MASGYRSNIRNRANTARFRTYSSGAEPLSVSNGVQAESKAAEPVYLLTCGRLCVVKVATSA
jgi:hypothetical protein